MLKSSEEPLMEGLSFSLNWTNWLAKLALSLAGQSAKPIDPKHLIYVATQVYSTGGHTRVIEDIVTVIPDYRHDLILTSMSSAEPHLVSLRARFDELGLKVHLLDNASPIEKAREVSSLIGALGAEAVLIFSHPYDPVANLGVDDTRRRAQYSYITSIINPR